jgi:glycosyltransferase involved in cell wall biosynthesis
MTGKRRIAVNALFQASGGSLTNLAQLLREWGASGALDQNELVIFASRGSAAALRREVAAATLAKVRIRILPLADFGLLPRLFAEQVQMPLALRRIGASVVFCPGNVVPFFTSVPTVATFQNAAPFCPSVTYRSLRGWKWLRFVLLGFFIRASARAATKVVFISRYFRDLFVSTYGFPPERGVIVPRGRIESPAAAPDREYERSLGITMPYVLCVSHLNPYKNIVELIDGWAAACRAAGAAGRQLVIAGMFNYPRYHRLVLEQIEKHGAAGRIILTGGLPTAGVHKLFAGAESFIFPSTCENCPTSLIEALSYALPTAASNLGPMPEIGGDAVLYFDPFACGEIAAVLAQLMTSPELRRDLARRAAERARGLPGEAEVALRTMAVIESVLPAEGR